jgi:uncharacterized protein (DUF924 family)
MTYEKVIDFWFRDTDPKLWWKKDEQFDQLIKDRFQETLEEAIRGELSGWRDHPLGRLAEIIVLDQFSRNIYRDSAQAFAQDAQALSLAQEAIELKADQALPPRQRAFLYLPYMHSESPEHHESAVALFSAAGMEGNLDFEMKHKAIIDRFGRYPHRNDVLGRKSTAEEIEFLQRPGSSF